jgi:hypothetical protein
MLNNCGLDVGWESAGEDFKRGMRAETKTKLVEATPCGSKSRQAVVRKAGNMVVVCFVYMHACECLHKARDVEKAREARQMTLVHPQLLRLNDKMLEVTVLDVLLQVLDSILKRY